jgi:hypothetical protein
VHKEFVPEGNRVNAEFYKGVIDRLLRRIQPVRPAAFCSRDFFLMHDNEPAHKAASVCKFFTQKCYPQYSPDLSPPDYFMFPKLEIKLKGLHFTDVAEIQEVVTGELKRRSKKRNFRHLFRKCAIPQTLVYMPIEVILNLKSYVSFS